MLASTCSRIYLSAKNNRLQNLDKYVSLKKIKVYLKNSIFNAIGKGFYKLFQLMAAKGI